MQMNVFDVFGFNLLRSFNTHNLVAQVSNGGDDVSHCSLTGDWRSGQSRRECTKSNPHPQHCLSWYPYMGL